MIQTIYSILQEAGREAYWPRHLELYGHQLGFLIYISAIIAVIIVLIGIYRGMRVWFHGKYDKEGQNFISFFFGVNNQGF